jgi:sec-independent protein translocase protein TatB
MFGVDSTEFIIVAIVALLVIGPKDLPAALRTLGRFVGKVRGMARHFTSGVESMMREAELEEMEKKWREENERIMREFPAVAADFAAEAQDQPPLPLEPPAELPPSPPSPAPGQSSSPASPADDKRELP